VHEEYDIPPEQPLVIKFTKDIESGQREIDAYRLMNEDYETARKIKVLPLIFGEPNMENPFTIERLQQRYDKEERGHDKECLRQLGRKESIMDHFGALVLPYHEKRFIHEVAQSMDDYKRYLRSLLVQLDHAHRLGVTNYDLQFKRNIFVDRDGDAVIIDWNGNMNFGEEIYDPTANFAYIPPEGWFRSISKYKPVVGPLDVYAVDVWQVGFILASLLFDPCEWAHLYCYSGSPKKLLRQLIPAISRNSSNIETIARLYTIPEAEEDEEIVGTSYKGDELVETVKVQARNLDYSKLVEIDQSQPTYTPILCKGRKACDATAFPMYDGLTQEEQKLAFDFLMSIFRISPRDRPTCGQLLKHPFLQQKKDNERLPVS
jgi:serine/threonine protein kinase